MSELTRLFWVIIVLFSLNCSDIVAASRLPATNPQMQLVGARSVALDSTNPTLEKELSSLFMNPATIGPIDKFEASLSSQRIFGQFEDLLINTCFPFQGFSIGLSLGSSVLNGIPQTTYEEERIRQIDSYSAGFWVFGGTVAKTFHDFFDMGDLSVGTTAKVYNYFIATQSIYAMGVDVGAQFSMPINYWFFQQLIFGGSFINLYSTPLAWPGYSDSSNLQKNLLLGVRAVGFNKHFSVSVQNNLDNDLSLSAEWLLGESVFIRGSVAPDFRNVGSLSSWMRKLHVGTGVLLGQVAGIGDEIYSMRLDYTYSQYADPMDLDPTHTFSISLLGSTQLSTSRILYPKDGSITKDQTTSLSGIGPENVKILVYNNDFLSRTITSDKNGKWEIPDFPLKEGDNTIYVKSFAFENDTYYQSKPILIKSDNSPPVLNATVYPDGNRLIVNITANEPLGGIEGNYNQQAIQFAKSTETAWVGSIDFPNDLKNTIGVMRKIKIKAEDAAGNQSTSTEIPFFIDIQSLTDRTFVYRDTVTLRGVSSALIKEIKINDRDVAIDSNLNFSIACPMQKGKNTIRVQLKTINGRILEGNLRLLKLKTFRDIKTIPERRIIEVLSALGILITDDPSYFYPDEPITRGELARQLVKSLNMSVSRTITNDVANDVSTEDPMAPYIQAVMQSGTMGSYTDGTFRPDQPITYEQVQSILKDAGLLKQSVPIDENRQTTRKDLARLLSKCTVYQRQIDALLDWNSGYL